MKIFHKLIYLLILIGTQLTLSAQSPLTFNHQAVLRDDAGQVMVEETVAIEVDINGVFT